MPAPHQSVFTDQMPFLPPNQQHQSTESTRLVGPCFQLNEGGILMLQVHYGFVQYATVLGSAAA